MAALSHQPYLDGLRAVAVIAVMAFHLDHDWLPGGFMGVDVFFVISGYLITSIIVAESSSGAFSLQNFFQRRIARILPLALFVIAAVLAGSAGVFTSIDFGATGAAATAAALSVANVKFMLQGDYFEASPDAQPLLHFWSLSLEEQYYLLLPPLITLAFKTKRPLRNLIPAVAVVALSSLALCIALTPTNRNWAFYLLPTRAWELLGGSLLAIVLPPDGKPRPYLPGGIRELLGWLSVAGLMGSFSLVGEGPYFPGAVAAVPVAATCLLIYSCHGGARVKHFLALSSLQRIGQISYSLYLWHWPVYCLADYGLRHLGEYERAACKLTLTICLSVTTFVTLERPARRWLSDPRRRSIAFGAAILGISLVSAAGALARQSTFVTAPRSELGNGGVAFNEYNGLPKLVLTGDSKAGVFSEPMIDLARELGFQLNVLAFSAENPIPRSELYADIFRQIERIRPEVVVFSAGWSRGDSKTPPQEIADIIKSDFGEHVRMIIVIGEPPLLPMNDYRAYIRSTGRSTVPEDRADRSLRTNTNELLKKAESNDFLYVDPDPFVTAPDGSIMLEDDAGQLLFQDRIHLSETGASMVVAKIRELLVDLQRRKIRGDAGATR
jgi:peptidoglycan/LPS O-acetylase OafA/YrhL